MAKRKTRSPSRVSKTLDCKPGDVVGNDCYQLYLVAALRKGPDCANRVVFDLSGELADLPLSAFGKKMTKKASPSKSRKK